MKREGKRNQKKLTPDLKQQLYQMKTTTTHNNKSKMKNNNNENNK